MGSGVAVSSSGLLMQSCMEKARKETIQTTVLSSMEVEMINGIVHHMIPDPELPEDVSLAIPLYIDITLTEYVDGETKETFIKGIQELQRTCSGEYGIPFLDCSKDQQLELLKKQELEFIGSQQPTFYGMLKQWVFEAFFQSEFGVTNYLLYDPLPGGYKGCVPVAEVGRIQHSNDVFKL